MEKSRRYMSSAACLLFVSQFFNYSKRDFGISIDSNLNYHGGHLMRAETGWDMHSWYSGLIIVIIAYLFYSNNRPLVYYIVSTIIMLPLSFGEGNGAIIGVISIAIAGYAIYLKTKENKIVKPKPA